MEFESRTNSKVNIDILFNPEFEDEEFIRHTESDSKDKLRLIFTDGLLYSPGPVRKEDAVNNPNSNDDRKTVYYDVKNIWDV